MEYGLWSACPNESILAYGLDGGLVGSVFVPIDGHVSWRGNPDEIRAFVAEWGGWVWSSVLTAISALYVAGSLAGGTAEYTVYEDDGNGTKVIVSQKGQAGVLYLIAFKMSA